MDFDSSALIKKLRLGLKVVAATAYRQVSDLMRQPLEPILHPSTWRLRWLGLFSAVGHPLFWWIWAYLLPQPYENAGMRMMLGLMGLSLLAPRLVVDTGNSVTTRVYSTVFWVQLPLFFSWMYLCNAGNTVWLASLCAMILIYYHVTDWRIATVGIAAGGLVAWIAFSLFASQPLALSPQQIAINGVVISFCWSSAMVLGVSSANLRREQLRHTLATMGIMAHELRTPLATVALIGDAIHAESRAALATPASQKLARLASRLHGLVRSMNHQIDMQIANARLQHLPMLHDHLSANELVSEALASYPYRSLREKECVDFVVRRDFSFHSSRVLFNQVIHNLLKNALHSLAATGRPAVPGDILVEIGVLQGRGYIRIADRGTGIEPSLLPRIFEPFFSTAKGTGHGLGLAFCERVVRGAGGSIRAQSGPARGGATFTMDLPIDKQDSAPA